MYMFNFVSFFVFFLFSTIFFLFLNIVLKREDMKIIIDSEKK